MDFRVTKDALAEYLRDNENTYNRTDFAYLYGPMILHCTDEFSDVIQHLKTYSPIMRLFIKARKLMDAIPTSTGTQSIQDIKRNIVNMNKEHLCSGESTDDIFSNTCTATLQNLRIYQKEQMLLESAMVGYAPIVPYGTTIRKANDGMEVVEPQVPYDVEEKALSNAELFKQILIEENGDYFHICDKLIQDFLLPIYQHYFIAPDVTYGATFDRAFDDLLITKSNMGKYYSFIQAYYFFAGCRFMRVSKDMILKFLDEWNVLDPTSKAFAATESTVVSLGLEDIVKSWSESTSTCVTDIDPYVFAGEAWENLDEDSQNHIEKILAGVTNESSASYDLDRLMSYIHIHRHIYCNTYANSLFLSETKDMPINNFNTFQNDVLLCEVKNSILVCPFTDLADDHAIKLLCINKEGEIYIRDTFDFNDIASDIEVVDHTEETSIE